jgi:hypothetical protein
VRYAQRGAPPVDLIVAAVEDAGRGG